MKTITEYQPMIFGQMIARASTRKIHRQQFLAVLRMILPLLYVLAGVFLMGDTGYTLLNWQFWLVFLPLVGVGEIAMVEVSARLR